MDQIQSQDISSVLRDMYQIESMHQERQVLLVKSVEQPRKEISIVQRKQLQNLNQLQFSLQFQFSLLIHQRGLGMVLAVLNH